MNLDIIKTMICMKFSKTGACEFYETTVYDMLEVKVK